jgi:hypothetical protein
MYENLKERLTDMSVLASTRTPADALQYIEELEAEIARLRLLVPRPDQTQDELVWRDHMRGVPLAALAKEFGCTKERMRYRLKKIAENKLHLTGGKDE